MKHLNQHIHLIAELAPVSVIKPMFARACAWMVRAKRAARVGLMR